MLRGREFQTEALEHVNEWRKIACLGLGMYMICWVRPK